MDSNRIYQGSATIKRGMNTVVATGTVTIDGDVLTGTSATKYVIKADEPTGRTCLSGIVFDEVTGYPVSNVRVILKDTGFYDYTDILGTWSLTDVPSVPYTVEILP